MPVTLKDVKGKKIFKCSYFVFVGYPHEAECNCTIEVSDNKEEAYKKMNDAGWRKCGNRYQWGYFCPRHAKLNKFYQKDITYASNA